MHKGLERTGLGLFHLRAGYAFIDLVDSNGKIGIELNVAGLKKGMNMEHFALKIKPSNEAEIRQHLKGCGIKAGEGVERYCADGVGPLLYIDDPDGNRVELKGPATRVSYDAFEAVSVDLITNSKQSFSDELWPCLRRIS